MRQPYLIAILTLFVQTTVLSQRQETIYTNNSNIKDNPQQKKLRKKWEKYNKLVTAGKIKDELPMCSSIYWVENKDTISFEKSLINYQKIIGDSNEIYFDIKIDWQGIIREIDIMLIKGNVDINSFKEFCSHFVAKPLFHFGIPVDTRCAYAIRKE